MSRRSDETNSWNSNGSSSPLHRHSRRSSPPPPHHHSPRFSRPGSSSTTSDQSVTDTPPRHLALPPPPSVSMDDDGGTTPNMALELRAPRPATASRTPTVPVREDCWSEEATDTLVEAWGERFLELNRGNLRQKHWQEVADAVNARHGHVRKARRTDVQCKNRIDTLKKKYKIEKSRVSASKGRYSSDWPFFSRLDALIGSSFKPSKPVIVPHRKPQPRPQPPPPLRALPPPPSVVPVAPRSKRPAVTAFSPAPGDDSFFRRNFSAIAAAAAAAEAEEYSEGSRSKTSSGKGDKDTAAEDCRLLAQAIEKLGRIFERVEGSKQRQLIELEKQRMQFAKDMELQRMQLFMDSQVQIERIKRAKTTSEDGY